MKTRLIIAGFSVALTLHTSAGVAQISTNGTSVTAPDKGITQNLSITSGSRTSLSVGNSTSFGTSTNLNTSAGLSAISRSSLIPSLVDISSKIGDNALGQTTINISNLSAKGGGGSINPVSGSAQGAAIDLTEGTQYASGNADIVGMGASVSLLIDPSKTNAAGEAQFFSVVHPTNYQNAACTPSSQQSCAFAATDSLVSGNAGASANLSTTTNIDINANSFVQTFAQSF